MEHAERVEKIQEFFVPDPDKEIEEIEYKELNEQLLSEYLRACERLDAMTKIREHLRQQIIRFMGQDTAATRGSLSAFLTTRKSTSINWEKYVSEEIGQEALQELFENRKHVKDGKVTSPYIEEKSSRVLEVRKGQDLPEV